MWLQSHGVIADPRVELGASAVLPGNLVGSVVDFSVCDKSPLCDRLAEEQGAITYYWMIAL